jgi:hypothetical protein
MDVSFAPLSWTGAGFATEREREILMGRFAIIPVLASNSPSLMLFGVPGLKKILTTVALLAAASFSLLSCGGYNSGTASKRPSGLAFRAFVSNPLQPGVVGSSPVLNIVDATLDVLSPSSISLGGSNANPGLMVLFPNKRFTLVFSGTTTSNTLAVINNASEGIAPASSGSTAAFTLPGPTESLAVGSDNVTGYAAVANATVTNQQPGAVEVLDLSAQTTTATLPVVGARFVVASHNGNRVLAMGSSPDTVTVISAGLIGTSQDPRTPVTNPSGCVPSAGAINSCPFDHPVWAIFSNDDSTAYIFNCGPQCGGTTAGITPLDMASNLPGTPIPVLGATFGLLQGSTLYVAGTPPGTPCGSGTLAMSCGALSAIDLGSMAVTNSAVITDGYHNQMQMGANGQLFIGAKACTNINSQTPNNTSGEIRGCLSIFNTLTSTVVVPPQNGDATGIAPITGRSVVYVCQGGALQIYDTTKDVLQTTQVSIIGQAVDVLLVD